MKAIVRDYFACVGLMYLLVRLLHTLLD